MSKLEKILEARIEYLKEQEAVLLKGVERLGKETNRLSSERETIRTELGNLNSEYARKRSELDREIRNTEEEARSRLSSIEEALQTRDTTLTEREKGINTREEELDASIAKFIGFTDEIEKTMVLGQKRDEKLTIYVQNLSEIVKMIFAILSEIGTISQKMDEGKTLAVLARKVYEGMELSAQEFADLIHFVRQEQAQIQPQREKIAQDTIRISDEWKQIQQAKTFISSKS